MEQFSVSDWISRREENLSTGSRNSDEEAASETTLIRYSNMQRQSGIGKRKITIGLGVVFLGLVIIGGAFGGVALSNRSEPSYRYPTRGAEKSASGSTIVIKDKEPISELDIDNGIENVRNDGTTIVKNSHSQAPEIKTKPKVSRKESVAVLATTASQAHSNASGMALADEPPQERDNSTTAEVVTKRRRNKSKGRRNRNQHKRKQLPADAQSKDSISLLYQMKLVPAGPVENFVNYKKCLDIDDDNRQFLKGWKASLTVNATMARISEDKNPFIGYGLDKRFARRRAGESALMAIYPGNLTYTYPYDDLAIEQYNCEYD